MKAVLKLGKSTLAIVIFTSLCFMSNYSHAQGLLGKIRKIQDDVKKTTDEVKKIKDDAKKIKDDTKNITGAGSGGSNGSSGSNGNSGNNGNSGSNGNNNAGSNNSTNNERDKIPSSDQDFVKKITVSNATGRQIYLMIHIYDGKKDITYPLMIINRIACDAGKDCVVDLVACAERSYLVRNSDGATVTKTVSERGKYVYNIQANFDDGLGRGEGKPDAFSTIVFSNNYNADDFKKSGNVIKVEISPLAQAELARKATQEEANKNANDPAKLGTLTIVNAVGGKGKIYCVLEVPSKQNSSKVTKMEFMLGENKGDKYVINKLRLFYGYRLNTMPESEKAKDPTRDGILFISNSLSGNSMDSFRMEDGLIGNVGVGMNR
jgi:hypothetical protein